MSYTPDDTTKTLSVRTTRTVAAKAPHVPKPEPTPEFARLPRATTAPRLVIPPEVAQQLKDDRRSVLY
jgi:hypothetical protein